MPDSPPPDDDDEPPMSCISASPATPAGPPSPGLRALAARVELSTRQRNRQWLARAEAGETPADIALSSRFSARTIRDGIARARAERDAGLTPADPLSAAERRSLMSDLLDPESLADADDPAVAEFLARQGVQVRKTPRAPRGRA